MQLKSLVPNEILEIKDIEEIYKAQQDQLNKLDIDIQDLLNQLYINTCTWGIVLWEKFAGIVSDPLKSLEERKARVLAKIRGQGTSTVEAIKNICDSYADDTKVVEHNEESWFEMILESYRGFPFLLDSLYDAIDEIKPAHLGTGYKLVAITNNDLYIAGTSLMGEIITTYPWTPTEIENNTDIYVPMTAAYAGVETITTYPKEG